jgi:sugar/nucleoside kinase (ribokinase family)
MSKHYNRTYLLVGTVTKDLLPDDSFTIGGTVTYAASVVKQLRWRPIIVTAAASDFTPPAYLADVDWRILPSSETTTFRNVYISHGRQQTVGPIARSITTADVPLDVRHATLVHLCPLAQDVEPEITQVFNNALLTATPQGWLRQWDTKGLVSLSHWGDSDRVLPKLQAAVISLEDVKGNWALAERWAAQTTTLIVTEGEKGCTILHQEQKISVPPRPAQPVDPTGAGDVFAAAFFIRFHETGQLWQSARFANVTASMSIERPGPEGVPHRDEIEAYIAQNPMEAS